MELIKTVVTTLLIATVFSAMFLKACDSEAEYQTAKYKQWHEDLKAERPFTDFSE